MSTRRKIDELYLSKFEGAEVAPPEEAWENIASRLPAEKKEKKLLPLWFRYAGTAAVLLLLVSLASIFSTSDAQSTVSGSVVSREDIYNKIQLSSQDFNQTMFQVSVRLQELMQKKTMASEVEHTGSGIASSALRESASKSAGSEGSGDSEGIAMETEIAEVADPFEEGPALAETSEISVAAGKDTGSLVAGDRGQLPGEQEEVAAVDTEKNAIAQQLSEELYSAKKESVEGTGGRMSISTRVAPVFYENVGNGNSQMAGMVGGEPSGEVALSYGVNLAYQVSDRIKLRTGVNKLDLSFSTPGVPMAMAMNAGSLPGESDPFLMARQEEGDLQHQMNFIEVPIEVEYRLLDSRIGLNLIAGGSSLFHNGDHMSVNTGIRTADLGQDESMEQLSFSANMGLGLDYRLSPALRLNLEPMFKYQVNSFSENSGIRPYYLAIYSGFSFSF